jgi:elongation factor P
MTIATNDIRAGTKLEIDGKPWAVISNEFIKPGKGTAFNKIKVKNLFNGQVVEKTYRSGEKIDVADVEQQTLNFFYEEEGGVVFINPNTHDQISVPNDVIEPIKHFLLEEKPYQITFYKGNPIEVVPPCFLEMKIVETTPAVKGDTSGRVLKAAKTHTGFTVQVPIFIQEDETILLDTRTGEYAKRASEK